MKCCVIFILKYVKELIKINTTNEQNYFFLLNTFIPIVGKVYAGAMYPKERGELF
jgi:hypothetical protein